MDVHSEDLELDTDDLTSGTSSQSVRKNIALKLKTKSRPSKRTVSSDHHRSSRSHVDVRGEAVAEIFAVTSEKVPLHHSKPLNWNHKIQIIGFKAQDPNVFCCEICSLPVLLYGRMIPCKHVFCITCANKHASKCYRCKHPVSKVENSPLGKVFVCTNGASKHSNGGCRRSYLSQRDLQAHIKYRHDKSSTGTGTTSGERQRGPDSSSIQNIRTDGGGSPPPGARNLISVPIQSYGGADSRFVDMVHSQAPPNLSLPPPLIHQSAVSNSSMMHHHVAAAPPASVYTMPPPLHPSSSNPHMVVASMGPPVLGQQQQPVSTQTIQRPQMTLLPTQQLMVGPSTAGQQLQGPPPPNSMHNPQTQGMHMMNQHIARPQLVPPPGMPPQSFGGSHNQQPPHMMQHPHPPPSNQSNPMQPLQRFPMTSYQQQQQPPIQQQPQHPSWMSGPQHPSNIPQSRPNFY